jgi:ApbE superfamily uncharacterized protein (UPF0280 family)
MSGGPQIALLPDGRRLHLHHGPIDLIAEAFGERIEIESAYSQAARRFDGLLQELVDELELLRTPINELGTEPDGPVARIMTTAVRSHTGVFVTSMAAVAGAVADTVLAAMVEGHDLPRAYVNNGGDIALHLADGESFTAGLVFEMDAPAIDGMATISGSAPVRGIATSGWQGRSLSLGIADSVTVLARTATQADVAATLIANAVNVDHPAVRRAPAEIIELDSDLGDRLVTVDVGELDDSAIAIALHRGEAAASTMWSKGLIDSAALTLQGQTRTIGIDAFLDHQKVA